MNAIRLALFGQPVSHSPSPHVHRAFGRQFGIEVDYRLIESTPDAFAGRLADFRSAGGQGCNITLPLKGVAYSLADERTARCALASAANTLWWPPDGRCHADNTDGEGLVRDLENNLSVAIRNKRVILLGAGGAAAGVLGPLLERGPSKVLIVNRTIERAWELARHHAGLGDVDCLPLTEIGHCENADIFVDATSMGHFGDQGSIPPDILSGAEICYSLNYGAAAQPLQELCQAAAARFADGLGMLVEQAAVSFAIWTNHRPDTAPVLADFANGRG